MRDKLDKIVLSFTSNVIDDLETVITLASKMSKGYKLEVTYKVEKENLKYTLIQNGEVWSFVSSFCDRFELNLLVRTLDQYLGDRFLERGNGSLDLMYFDSPEYEVATNILRQLKGIEITLGNQVFYI